MSSTASRMTKAVLGMIIIATASKILGLIRESITAAYFGADFQTDAYRVASEIPALLTGAVYAAVSTTFIPVYSEFKVMSREQRLYFVNNIFNIVVIITAAMVILGTVLAPALVKIIAPGFNGESFKLSVKLTVLVCPSIVFLALAYLANGYLQANRNFIIPALLGIPLNLITITGILFFFRYGIVTVAIAGTIASISQFAVQIPSLIKAGYRFKPVVDFKEAGLNRLLLLSIPVIISSAFNEVSILVDKMLASGLAEGSITVLDYASKVTGMANGIFIASLAIVIFPELSSMSDNPEGFRKTTLTGLNVVILISLPVMASLIVLRLPIIRVLFERGAFNTDDAYFTSVVLGFFSAGIIGWGFTEVLNRAFYSLKDTKTPMVNGITVIGINTLLSLMLVRFWGISGLAVSSSIASLISGVILFLRIKKKIHINCRVIGISFVKSASASAVMGLIMYLINNVQINSIYNGASFAAAAAKLVVSISMGGLVYTGILYVLKTEELNCVIGLIRNKMNSLIKH